jgi:hypothetical protein
MPSLIDPLGANQFDLQLPCFPEFTAEVVGPILEQREAYVDLWCSCQIGDAYIDLSIHLFDTYTKSKVNAAPPLNPNTT